MESVSSRQVLIKYSGLLSTRLSVVKVCKQTTYYSKMIKIVGIWLGVIWATMAVAQQGAQQRYVGLQLLNLNAEPDYGADIIEQSVGAGANLVVLTIYWDEVYKTATSQPDWRQPDRQMEQIARLGVKAGIRIMLGRKAERLQGFWTSNETMNDDLGRQLWGVYGRTCFSFAHAPTVTKAQGFLKEVCQRYNAYQSQGNILYVTFVNTPTQELGYHYETELNGDYKQVYPTGFDYSSPSLEAFKGWITQQYKRINKLNYIWGTKFTSLNDVRPPTTAYRPLPAYRTRAGKDWYLFSHLQLKNFIDQSIRTIKQVNPSYKVVNEYGAVIDAQAAVRGTIAFKNLDQEADGTKVHNDLYWNHRFITDVVRSNRPGKWIMNETFFSPVYSDDLLIKHFDECFENGCNVVTMVASTKDARLSSIFGPVAARWKNNPWSELRSNATISYKVTEVLDSTSVVVEKAWRTHAQPSPIEVKIEEDILGEDYWRILATNVYPVVANPIIDRATKPKKTYSYTLPKDVFLDPDGEIVTIEALEKPQWLTFSNGTLTGTVPDQLGESKITLRAIDDEGATVQTSFLLKIVNVNQKPVVKRTLPDFESSLNQTISYPIQGDIFDDPDGVIVRTQAIGLRPWMSFNSKEFSAYPQEQGTFTITLRGIDDGYIHAFGVTAGDHGLVWSGTAWNSFWTTLQISLVSAVPTAAIGLLTAWLLVRQEFGFKRAFEFGTMLSFAIPGTVIGIAYVLAFNVPPIELTGTGIILVIAFIFRNMPVGVRAGIATMSQLDRSLDEASLTLRAGNLTTVRRVILPLLRPAILAALVYSFVRAMTAISAVVFLVSANYEMATTYILGRVENGDYGLAIAYSSVLILVMLAVIAVFQLAVGQRRLGRRAAPALVAGQPA